MFEQEFDDALARLGVFHREAEALEVLVLADQLRGSVGKQIEEPFESRAVEGLFQIFDDVELDAALAQDFQRAA